MWYDAANGVDNVRVEGWEFIVGGAAGFIHLNGDFSDTNSAAAGTPTESTILPQKKILKDFIHGLNFVQMARFEGFSGVPGGAVARAIAEPGQQYALYIHHSSNEGSTYRVAPGSYQEAITLQAVPADDYTVEWVSPASGAVLETSTVTSNGGDVVLQTPTYTIDIALRMRRAGLQVDASVPPRDGPGLQDGPGGDGPGPGNDGAPADGGGPPPDGGAIPGDGGSGSATDGAEHGDGAAGGGARGLSGGCGCAGAGAPGTITVVLLPALLAGRWRSRRRGSC